MLQDADADACYAEEYEEEEHKVEVKKKAKQLTKKSTTYAVQSDSEPDVEPKTKTKYALAGVGVKKYTVDSESDDEEPKPEDIVAAAKTIAEVHYEKKGMFFVAAENTNGVFNGGGREGGNCSLKFKLGDKEGDHMCHTTWGDKECEEVRTQLSHQINCEFCLILYLINLKNSQFNLIF